MNVNTLDALRRATSALDAPWTDVIRLAGISIHRGHALWHGAAAPEADELRRIAVGLDRLTGGTWRSTVG